MMTHGSNAAAAPERGALTLEPVGSPAQMRRFIRLPMRLHADDPSYIAPLLSERGDALSPKKNPFFDHAQVRFWLAMRDGRDVGRISAQIDSLAPPQDGRRIGHFGLIAAEDDPEIFATLLRAAEDWLRARGCERAVGPVNLSMNEEVGLLVEGFDTPPMVMMGHDPPYAGPRVAAEGYAKVRDVYAYACSLSDAPPAPVVRRVRRGLPEGVRLRMADMKRYDEEVATITDILNDAWAGNWGFTPTTETETRALAKAMRAVIDPRLTWFAEIDGEVAGFILLLPNVNEAIADLRGRLAPFGWLKLLWRLKVVRVKSIRVPLMGVRRRFGRSLRGRLLPFHLIDRAAAAARALGYRRAELSWILEDNAAMRSIIEASGGSIYKTYRIYQKDLA